MTRGRGPDDRVDWVTPRIHSVSLFFFSKRRGKKRGCVPGGNPEPPVPGSPTADDDAGMAEPWDQQPGEPNEAYARFLLYRNLGPGRTLQTAYATFIGTFRNAVADETRGKKTQLPLIPGHWGEDSGRWRWRDRATGWDVHTLSTHGERLSVLWVGILLTAAEKCAQRLADPRCKPRDFSQCVAVLDKLAGFLTPDVVKALQPPAQPHQPGPKPDRAAVK